MQKQALWKLRAIVLASAFLVLGWGGAATAATSSVKCNNGTVTVSAPGGACDVADNGNVRCTSGANGANDAHGGCDVNGNAVCGSSTGDGSCTITKKQPGRPDGATTGTSLQSVAPVRSNTATTNR